MYSVSLGVRARLGLRFSISLPRALATATAQYEPAVQNAVAEPISVRNNSLGRSAQNPWRRRFDRQDQQERLVSWGPRESATAMPASVKNSAAASHLFAVSHTAKRNGRVSAHEIDVIIERLAISPPLTSAEALQLIRMCGSLCPEATVTERSNMVHRAWIEMQKHGVKFDVSHYNALLLVYLENDFSFAPTDFLKRLEAEKVEPNRVTYQRLLIRYCHTGELDQAATVLEFMKKNEMAVNEAVYHAMILGQLRKGDEATVQALLDMMKASPNLAPNLETVNTLLRGYAERGDKDSIDKTLATAEVDGISVTDKELLNTIYHLSINGHADAALQMLQQLPKRLRFNQLAYNTVLPLVNAKQYEVAYKLCEIMVPSLYAESDVRDSGHFFLRQMVRSDTPTDVVITYCKSMQEAKLHQDPLSAVCFVALRLQKLDAALEYVRALKKEGRSLSVAHFHPIAIMQLKANDYDGFRDTMDWMVTHRCLHEEFFAHFVFPNTTLGFDEVRRMANDSKVKTQKVVGGFVAYCLAALPRGLVSDAKAILSRIDAPLNCGFIEKYLARGYQSCRDADSIAQIMRCMQERADTESTSDWCGHVLFDVSLIYPTGLLALLKAMLNKGVRLDTRVRNRYRQWTTIPEQDKEEVLQIVEQLMSLDPSTIPNELQVDKSAERAEQMPRPTDEQMMTMLQAKYDRQKATGDGHVDVDLLLRLLSDHCHRRNVDAAEVLVADAAANGFQLGPGHLAQVCYLHILQGNLDKALEYRKQLEATSNTLYAPKEFALITLLVESGRIHEAIDMLKNMDVKGRGDMFNFTGVRALMSAAKACGDAQALRELVDTLLARQIITSKMAYQHTMAPIVELHLEKGELDSAVKVYKECLERTGRGPAQVELLQRLLMAKADDLVATVFNETSAKEGEHFALHSLAFAKIEAGDVVGARKIFDRAGFSVLQSRLDEFCASALRKNRLDSILGLIRAARGKMSSEPLDKIYQHLLHGYQQHRDYNSALNAWQQMQEDDVQPSNATLRLIASILQENNQPIPFRVPTSENETVDVAQQKGLNMIPKIAQLLKDAPQKAVKQLTDPAYRFPANLYSDAVDALMQKGFPEDARILVSSCLRQGITPNIRALKQYVAYLTDRNDVKALAALRTALPPTLAASMQLRRFERTNELRTNKAKGEDYLSKLENSENTTAFANPDDIYDTLTAQPTLEPKVLEIASKYALQRQFGPYAALWKFYVTNGQLDKAEKLWNEHPLRPFVHFGRLSKELRQNSKEDALRWLLTQCKTAGERAMLYSDLIGIKTKDGDLDTACALIREAEQTGIGTSIMKHFPLSQLQVALQNQGKPVPFKLLSRENQGWSQRSRSDNRDSRKSAKEFADSDEQPKAAAMA